MPKAKRVPPKPSMPAPVNPLGVKSVYANNMQLVMSSLDARLLFNEIIAEGGPFTVERRANVVMSIPHFRAMVQIMNDHVKKLDERAAASEKQPVAEK